MKSSLYNYTADVGDAIPTQRSGGQPEYEPIRAACNRLAQLCVPVHTCCRDSVKVARDVCAAPRHSLREALYCVCVSLVKILPSPTSDTIEARLCQLDGGDDDSPVEFTLYIKKQ